MKIVWKFIFNFLSFLLPIYRIFVSLLVRNVCPVLICEIFIDNLAFLHWNFQVWIFFYLSNLQVFCNVLRSIKNIFKKILNSYHWKLFQSLGSYIFPTKAVGSISLRNGFISLCQLKFSNLIHLLHFFYE